jgi:hypothetical protein
MVVVEWGCVLKYREIVARVSYAEAQLTASPRDLRVIERWSVKLTQPIPTVISTSLDG